MVVSAVQYALKNGPLYTLYSHAAIYYYITSIPLLCNHIFNYSVYAISDYITIYD